ncbi:MAG TPA: acetate--CoA ligase family protein, partial [Candidatus Limnocylindrales bacterium]
MHDPDLRAIRAILTAARAQGRDSLTEPEGLALLGALGIAVPAWRLIGDEREVDDQLLTAFSGDRVVLKAVAPGLAHKTEHGGVAFPGRTIEGVLAAVAAMRARLPSPPTGFTLAQLVAHDRDPGGELLLAFRWTDDLGPVAAVGAGGVSTELLAADLRPGRELGIV